MTVQEALNLKQGQIVYHTSKRNADGTAMRAKVLSIKRWKTRPSNVIVSVKHGLYDYATFNELQLDQLTIIEPVYEKTR